MTFTREDWIVAGAVWAVETACFLFLAVMFDWPWFMILAAPIIGLLIVLFCIGVSGEDY